MHLCTCALDSFQDIYISVLFVVSPKGIMATAVLDFEGFPLSPGRFIVKEMAEVNSYGLGDRCVQRCRFDTRSRRVVHGRKQLGFWSVFVYNAPRIQDASCGVVGGKLIPFGRSVYNAARFDTGSRRVVHGRSVGFWRVFVYNAADFRCVRVVL
ncbi:hypothetical protein HNY73_007389 [Argiope bruennichi]|uniref:Uncharacterized protein n=1 Tax=Argiope bruennichi TaxID=94029 RepID=A0A8T0FGD8_ARGBR|nr:hypothetical protein HNY73_007389 [Argiope bruennichi]